MLTDQGVVERNRAAVLEYLEGHRTDRLRSDAVFANLSTGDQWVGPTAIGGMLDWFYHAAFEARVEDSRLIVGEDAVALIGTFAGRHTGSFAGIEATGRDVRVPLVVVYDLEDGQIVAGRFLFDTATFLAQATA